MLVSVSGQLNHGVFIIFFRTKKKNGIFKHINHLISNLTSPGNPEICVLKTKLFKKKIKHGMVKFILKSTGIIDSISLADGDISVKIRKKNQNI